MSENEAKREASEGHETDRRTLDGGPIDSHDIPDEPEGVTQKLKKEAAREDHEARSAEGKPPRGSL